MSDTRQKAFRHFWDVLSRRQDPATVLNKLRTGFYAGWDAAVGELDKESKGGKEWFDLTSLPEPGVEVRIRLRDGSELEGAILQGDLDWWWMERFFNHNEVTYWSRIKAAPAVSTPQVPCPRCYGDGSNMVGGYRADLEDAVRVACMTCFGTGKVAAPAVSTEEK